MTASTLARFEELRREAEQRIRVLEDRQRVLEEQVRLERVRADIAMQSARCAWRSAWPAVVVARR